MVSREGLFRTYHALRARLVPSLRYSQELYEEQITALTANKRWLDLGCGHQVLPAWRATQEEALVRATRFAVGIDYELGALQKHRSITLRVRGDLGHLPFDDASFDVASANMVLEHLDKPEDVFAEVHRVLAPGGVFAFHTPNAWGYSTLAARMVPQWPKVAMARVLEARASEDVFPTHYRANTFRQLRQLARDTGFEVVKFRAIVTDAVFATVPPLAVSELLWIRLLMSRPFKSLRPNLLGVLQRPC